jgi:hypothetical protein
MDRARLRALAHDLLRHRPGGGGVGGRPGRHSREGDGPPVAGTERTDFSRLEALLKADAEAPVRELALPNIVSGPGSSSFG